MQGKAYWKKSLIYIALLGILLISANSQVPLEIRGKAQVGASLDFYIAQGDQLVITGPSGTYIVTTIAPQSVPFIPQKVGEYLIQLYLEEQLLQQEKIFVHEEDIVILTDKKEYIVGENMQIIVRNAKTNLLTITDPDGKKNEFFSHAAISFPLTLPGVYSIEVSGKVLSIPVQAALQIKTISQQQDPAVLNHPVNWTLEVYVSGEGKAIVRLPASATILQVNQKNVQGSLPFEILHPSKSLPTIVQWNAQEGNYVIKYQTGAPTMHRSQQGKDTLIEIESPLPYTNVLAQVSTPPVLKSKIQLLRKIEEVEYDITNSPEYEVSFLLNTDGMTRAVYWRIPYTSGSKFILRIDHSIDIVLSEFPEKTELAVEYKKELFTGETQEIIIESVAPKKEMEAEIIDPKGNRYFLFLEQQGQQYLGKYVPFYAGEYTLVIHSTEILQKHQEVRTFRVGQNSAVSVSPLSPVMNTLEEEENYLENMKVEKNTQEIRFISNPPKGSLQPKKVHLVEPDGTQKTIEITQKNLTVKIEDEYIKHIAIEFIDGSGNNYTREFAPRLRLQGVQKGEDIIQELGIHPLTTSEADEIAATLDTNIQRIEDAITHVTINESFLKETHIDPQSNAMIITPAEAAGFRPGIYKIVTEFSLHGENQTQIDYYALGLVSINTLKPLYHPGEFAELRIVVLDEKGFTVPDASIELNMSTPSGQVITLSTRNDQISRTEIPGVYAGRILLQETGHHVLNVEASFGETIVEIESYVNTVVDYPYDLVRNVPSTIDPWQGPFVNEFSITTFNEEGEFTFMETLPSDFEIIEADGALIQKTPNAIYLTWENVQDQDRLSYTAQTPLVTPYLYKLGPAQIIVSDSETFKENRTWMLAIDPQLTGSQNRQGEFVENWESGSYFTNSWVHSVYGATTSWNTSTTSPKNNVYILRTENIDGSNATIYTLVSTEGYRNIFVSFYTAYNALDSGEFINVMWENGSTNNVSLMQCVSTCLNCCSQTTLTQTSANLSGIASANNNSGFKIVLSCRNNGAVEYCAVDDIRIIGDPLPTPPVVENITTTPTLQITGSQVNLSFDVFDHYYPIDTVIAEYRYPSGARENYTMAEKSGTNYVFFFNDTIDPGNYTVKIFANISTGQNDAEIFLLNNTEEKQFEVRRGIIYPNTTALIAFDNITIIGQNWFADHQVNITIYDASGLILNQAFHLDTNSSGEFRFNYILPGNISSGIMNFTATRSNLSNDWYSNVTLSTGLGAITDKPQYAIGEIAKAEGTGFLANNNVTVYVFDNTGDPLIGYPINITANSTNRVIHNISTASLVVGTYRLNFTETINRNRSAQKTFEVVLAVIETLAYRENSTLDYEQGINLSIIGTSWTPGQNVNINITHIFSNTRVFTQNLTADSIGGINTSWFIPYNATAHGENEYNLTAVQADLVKFDYFQFNVTPRIRNVSLDYPWYKENDTLAVVGQKFSAFSHVELKLLDSNEVLWNATNVTANDSGDFYYIFPLPLGLSRQNMTLNATDQNFTNLNNITSFEVVSAQLFADEQSYNTGDLVTITGEYWDRNTPITINLTNSTSHSVVYTNVTSTSLGEISTSFTVSTSLVTGEVFNLSANQSDQRESARDNFTVYRRSTLRTDTQEYLPFENVNITGEFYLADGTVALNITDLLLLGHPLGFPSTIIANNAGNISAIWNTSNYCNRTYFIDTRDTALPEFLYSSTNIRVLNGSVIQAEFNATSSSFVNSPPSVDGVAGDTHTINDLELSFGNVATLNNINYYYGADFVFDLDDWEITPSRIYNLSVTLAWCDTGIAAIGSFSCATNMDHIPFDISIHLLNFSNDDLPTMFANATGLFPGAAAESITSFQYNSTPNIVVSRFIGNITDFVNSSSNQVVVRVNFSFRDTGTGANDALMIDMIKLNATVFKEIEMPNCLLVDITPPAVLTINATPSIANIGHHVEINATVNDERGISVVLAEITFPNGTKSNATLSNDTAIAFSVIFNETYPLTGIYNISIIANDTSNNVNVTQKSNFSVQLQTLAAFTQRASYIENETVHFSALGFNSVKEITIHIFNSTRDLVNTSVFPYNLSSNITGGVNGSWLIPGQTPLGVYTVNFTDTTDFTRSVEVNFSIVSAIISADLLVYEQGEPVNVSGQFWTIPSNISVNITNPLGSVVFSTILGANSTGHINTTYLLPYDAIIGTYVLNATSLSDGKKDIYEFSGVLKNANVSVHLPWYKENDTVHINGSRYSPNSTIRIRLLLLTNDTLNETNITSTPEGTINFSLPLALAVSPQNITVNVTDLSYPGISNITRFEVVYPFVVSSQETYNNGDTVNIGGNFWDRNTPVSIIVRNSSNNIVYETAQTSNTLGQISFDYVTITTLLGGEVFNVTANQSDPAENARENYTTYLIATLRTNYIEYLPSSLVNMNGRFFSPLSPVITNLTSFTYGGHALGFPREVTSLSDGNISDSWNTTNYCDGEYRVEARDTLLPDSLFGNTTFHIVNGSVQMQPFRNSTAVSYMGNPPNTDGLPSYTHEIDADRVIFGDFTTTNAVNTEFAADFDFDLDELTLASGLRIYNISVFLRYCDSGAGTIATASCSTFMDGAAILGAIRIVNKSGGPPIQFGQFTSTLKVGTAYDTGVFTFNTSARENYSLLQGGFSDFVDEETNVFTLRVVFNSTDDGAGTIDAFLIDRIYTNVTYFRTQSMVDCETFDILAPNVTLVKPTTGTPYNLTQQVNISANITDNWNVSHALAQIHYPNGTLRNFTMMNMTSSGIYNISFADTYATGRYNVTILANDSWNNVNNTMSTWFSVAASSSTLTISFNPSSAEIKQMYLLQANFSYLHGGPVSSATCVESGNFSAFTGRYYLPFSGDAPPNESIWGNRSHRIDFYNLTLNASYYSISVSSRRKGLPQEDLNVYLRCDGGTSFNASYRVGSIATENISYLTTYFPQQIVVGAGNISSNNCSVFLDSYQTNAITGGYYQIGRTPESNMNRVFLSEDNGSTWISAPGVDAVDMSFAAENVTLSYNTSTRLFEGFMHQDIPDTFTHNVSCTSIDAQSQINSSQIVISDIVSPHPQAVNLSMHRLTYGLHNLTYVWTALDHLLQTSYGNISSPSGNTLYQNFSKIVTVGSPVLSELGNYTLLLFAKDTIGNLNTTSQLFEVVDGTAPDVTQISPENSTKHNTTTAINITANITDLSSLQVIANITSEYGTIWVNLTDINADNIFNGTFVNGTSPGIYNVTIVAQDGYGNLNNTEYVQIIILELPFASTDKNQYVRNESVTITGGGYNLFQNVSVHIRNSTNASIPPFPVNVTADHHGRIVANWTIPITQAFDTYNVTTVDTTELWRNASVTFEVVNAIIQANSTFFYQGDTAIISGISWTPFGNVSYNLTDPLGNVLQGYPRIRQANGSGHINDTVFLNYNFSIGNYILSAIEVENNQKSDNFTFELFPRPVNIVTDYSWYRPGHTVNLSGYGFSINATLNISVELFNNLSLASVASYPKNISSDEQGAINAIFPLPVLTFGDYTYNVSDRIFPNLNDSVTFELVNISLDTSDTIYSNGEIVTITGHFWNRSENVSILIVNVSGSYAPGFPRNATADADGTFVITTTALSTGTNATYYNVTVFDSDSPDLNLTINYSVLPASAISFNETILDQNMSILVSGSGFLPSSPVDFIVRYLNGSGVVPFYPKRFIANSTGGVIDYLETTQFCEGEYIFEAKDIQGGGLLDSNSTFHITYLASNYTAGTANSTAFEGSFTTSSGNTESSQASDGAYITIGSLDSSVNAFLNFTFNATGVNYQYLRSTNVYLEYCYSGNQISPVCGTGANGAEGTPDGVQELQVFNFSSGTWIRAGDLNVGSNDAKINTTFNLSGITDLFNSSRLYLRAEVDFNLSTPNDSILVVDYARLNITYEYPVERACQPFDNSYVEMRFGNSTVGIWPSVMNLTDNGISLDDDGGLDGILEGYSTDGQLLKYITPATLGWLFLNMSIDTSSGSGPAQFRINNLHLNETRNVTSQFVENYTSMLPDGINETTPIFALNDSGIEFGFVEIALPTRGFIIDSILHCLKWSYGNASCESWEVNDTAEMNAMDNGTHILFNVTRFDSFGGGGGDSIPNVTVVYLYDVTDTGDNGHQGGTPISSGLNMTHNLSSNRRYRATFEILNVGNRWNIGAADRAFQSGLNASWYINHTRDVWYSVDDNITNITGGEWFNGYLNWTLTEGRLNNGEIGYWNYVFNVTTNSTQALPLYFLINDTSSDAGSFDNSAYQITGLDVFIISAMINVSNVTPIEGQNITVNANISNMGNISADNLTILIRNGNNESGILLLNTTINISAHRNVTVNTSFIAYLGINNVTVTIDLTSSASPNGDHVETNEANNIASLMVNVSFYHIQYGKVNMNVSLANSLNMNQYLWETLNVSGKVYAADIDSQIGFYTLQSLGRNDSDLVALNDFEELDYSLNSTNLTDSINTTWTQNGAPVGLLNLSIYGIAVNNVPVVNSTNSSNFLTGILWDMSDGGMEYNRSQDIVFIAPVNFSQVGQYGTYDFEIKLPATLSRYTPSTNEIAFYLELQ